MTPAMTPAARGLGQRLRIGYCFVLLALVCGLFAAGAQVRDLLGLDALHAGMINAAGRQRYLGVQAVDRVLRSVDDPIRFPQSEIGQELAGWSQQQQAVKNYLMGICRPADPLCGDFGRLEAQQGRVVETAKKLLAADSAAVVGIDSSWRRRRTAIPCWLIPGWVSLPADCGRTPSPNSKASLRGRR